MTDLNEIWIFTRVVEAGSFTAAARSLEMPKSTVSRKVAELEERLGARLLQRTTRKLSLTDVGRTFYEHCARVMAQVEEAEQAVTDLQEAPRGMLRVTAPLNFGFLGPILAEFLLEYPEVRVDLVCTDRVVDLIDEGFDVAIRAGKLNDSTLIARTLGVARRFIVTSPAYLAKSRPPERLSDLPEHECLSFGAGLDRVVWRLERDGRVEDVEVHARLTVNDFDLLRGATIAGLGIALLPLERCIDDLKTGRLVRVLRDYQSAAASVHAVYPSSRHLSPKLRAFLDHLHAHMSPPPWELGPLP